MSKFPQDEEIYTAVLESHSYINCWEKNSLIMQEVGFIIDVNFLTLTTAMCFST